MPQTEGSASMFDTVKNHEERITILEKNDRDHQEKLETFYRIKEPKYRARKYCAEG